jgi:hypothetical protein
MTYHDRKEHLMKLRIRGNSIRLRLGRGEVASLLENGKVEEATEFGAGLRFEYALRTSASAPRFCASFGDGRIEVLLPTRLAREWADSEEVGISSDQPLGPAGDLGAGSLHLLIEKDFACIKAPANEDQSDAFPHPEDAACKADE